MFLTLARRNCRSAENINQKYLNSARIPFRSISTLRVYRDCFASFNSFLFLQTRVLSRAFLRFSKSEDKMYLFEIKIKLIISVRLRNSFVLYISFISKGYLDIMFFFDIFTIYLDLFRFS